MGQKRSVFKEPHEYLEQSFCTEIAIVAKHFKIAKEMVECVLTYTAASRKAQRA